VTKKATSSKDASTAAMEGRSSTLITITIMGLESRMHMIGIGRKIRLFACQAAR
jgi:hypothetical protein